MKKRWNVKSVLKIHMFLFVCISCMFCLSCISCSMTILPFLHWLFCSARSACCSAITVAAVSACSALPYFLHVSQLCRLCFFVSAHSAKLCIFCLACICLFYNVVIISPKKRKFLVPSLIWVQSQFILETTGRTSPTTSLLGNRVEVTNPLGPVTDLFLLM